jgi:hypothetical protein
VAGLTLARGVEGPSLLLVAYTAVVFIAVAAFVAVTRNRTSADSSVSSTRRIGALCPDGRQRKPWRSGACQRPICHPLQVLSG